MDTPYTAPPAFAAEIAEKRRTLKAFATSLCRNPTHAEDLAQDTIMKAIGKWDGFEQGTNLEAWLFTILRNLYYSEYRKQKREVADSDGELARLFFVTPATQDSGLDLDVIREHIALLTPEHRQAIELSMQEYSYEEMAEITGVPVGTMKSRVNRARMALAKSLLDAGFELSGVKFRGDGIVPASATPKKIQRLPSPAVPQSLPAPSTVRNIGIQPTYTPKISVQPKPPEYVSVPPVITITPAHQEPIAMPPVLAKTFSHTGIKLSSYPSFDRLSELRDAYTKIDVLTTDDLVDILRPGVAASISSKSLKLYVSMFVNGGMFQMPTRLPKYFPALIARSAELDPMTAYHGSLSEMDDETRGFWLSAFAKADENPADAAAVLPQPAAETAIAGPVEPSNAIDTALSDLHEMAALLRHLFLLQGALAGIGMKSVDIGEVRTDFSVAAQALRALPAETKTYWLTAFRAAMDAAPKAPAAAPTFAAPQTASVAVTETAPMPQSVNESAPAIAQEMPETSGASVAAVHAVPAAQLTSKPLIDYPLFADGRHERLRLALQQAGIAARRELIDALVERGFKKASLQGTLNDLLHGQSIGNKYGRLSPVASCMVEKLAKLTLAEALSASAVPPASEPAPADIVPSLAPVSPQLLSTPVIAPPAAPEVELPAAPPPVADSAVAEQLEEKAAEAGLPATAAHSDEAGLLHDLKAAFPFVAAELVQHNIGSVESVWQRVPALYRGKRQDFVDQLRELVATRQPYNLETNSRLKIVSSMLSMALTPGQPVSKLWGECGKAHAQARMAREPNRQFATLMVKHSPNLFPASKTSSGKTGAFTLQTPAELRAMLESSLHGMPKEERQGTITSYVRLLSAEDDLMKNKNLTLAAAEVIDLFRIPSREVIEAVPKLAGELLYSDTVRQHFPNLAQLMMRQALFTMAAMEEKCDPPPINESGSGVILDRFRTLFMEQTNGEEEVHGGADHRAFAAC